MDNSNLINLDFRAMLAKDRSYEFLRYCEISAKIRNGVKFHKDTLPYEEYPTMEEVMKDKKL